MEHYVPDVDLAIRVGGGKGVGREDPVRTHPPDLGGPAGEIRGWKREMILKWP